MSTFAVATDHPSFDGHFPGEPVLPGVVILAEALAVIAEATCTAAMAWKVESVKFHGGVGPGAALAITHAAHGEQSHRFEVHDGPRLITSGTLTRRAT
jgi:3-hydroxymyristoyl/3-hydroxydecanoyl-(acyl carrier protein) dehydratase